MSPERPLPARAAAARPGPGVRSAGRRHRDRHGRGLRGELAPRAVPLWRTKGERFDDLVLDAVEELEERWSAELADVDFAVEDVPDPGSGREFDPDVVADRGVPLGRLVRSGMAPAGPKPVIVVYRRPVEARAAHVDDRGDLVFAVVAELVAELLGRDVEDIAP